MFFLEHLIWILAEFIQDIFICFLLKMADIKGLTISYDIFKKYNLSHVIGLGQGKSMTSIK